MTEFSCVLSAAMLGRAYHCVSTEQTRYYLGGVYVEPCPEGGALLVATDGKVMAILRDPDGVVSGSAIVKLSPETLKACRNKKNETALLVVKGQQAIVAYHVAPEDRAALASEFDPAGSHVIAAQLRETLIDGSFPDWRRVVPANTDPAAPIGTFDPGVIDRAAKALCAGKPFVQVWASGGRQDPHVVLPGGGFGLAFGVVMPVRNEAGSEMPTWHLSRPDPVSMAAE